MTQLEQEGEYDKLWKIHGSVLRKVMKALRMSGNRDLADELEEDGWFNLQVSKSDGSQTYIINDYQMIRWKQLMIGEVKPDSRVDGAHWLEVRSNPSLDNDYKLAFEQLKQVYLDLRRPLREALYKCNVPSNPCVSDEWILERVISLMRNDLEVTCPEYTDGFGEIRTIGVCHTDKDCEYKVSGGGITIFECTHPDLGRCKHFSNK